LALDTVNEHGGWQGSLDARQLHWLADELSAADREQRYVVLASHHPLSTLVNPRLPITRASHAEHRRAVSDEVAQTLSGHRCLVLWLNGHTHQSTIRPHGTWWEVTAPSLIDFPQQGRVVELLRSAAGELVIATTMLDHDGEVPWSGRIDSVTALAGLSRELAANDWQRRTDDLTRQRWAGTPSDRNTLLRLPDPFA
jgi:3',5'-cyclic AMP phosphodiesterase CpdA